MRELRLETVPARVVGVALLALLTAAPVLAQSSQPRSAPAASTPAKSGDSELVKELDELLARFPENLRNSKLDSREVPALADRILMLAREYVTQNPKGTRAAELHYQIARFSAMNNQRYVVNRMNELRGNSGAQVSPEQVKAIRDEYILNAIAHLDQALKLEPSEELVIRVARCRGTLYYFGNYFDAAAEVYQELLAKYPGDASSDETLTSLIGAYEKSRKFELAHEKCDQFLANHLDSDFAPHIINYKAKMLLYLGRLRETATHLEKFELFMKRAYGGLPAGDTSLVYPPRVRKDFESYIDRLPFQIAFAKYALGDPFIARERLEESVQTLNAKAARQALNQVGQVYLDRSKRVLSVLEDLQGYKAPSLESVERWIEDPVDLEKEAGNVVALLFFPYENIRSEGYLKAVQSFMNERWSEGFRAAWIALPKGKKDFDGQLRRVQTNALELGLTMPVGLATFETWPPTVYSKYNIAPGTPTVVFINKSGVVAWYKMDPTFRDFATSARVVERLLRD